MIGVTVGQGRWAAVTAGEWDRRTGLVTVNIAVVEAVHARHGHDPSRVHAAIVAHELVHALSTREAPSHEEEARARAAAVAAAGEQIVRHIDEVLARAWS